MSTTFPPTRHAALERLEEFVPKAGKYAATRNYDHGPGNHTGVSTLSPYIRHRVITEEEVLRAVLDRYAPSTVEKFVQEVYWRTYWKGWLEMRPSVWGSYRAGLNRALDQVQTQGGLRAEWETAGEGETGIDGFDAWAKELVETGYLHNHARMWFASIWIFTLRLPWELGADFFLRHLKDGDVASNTLGWRWVAGIQTKGKAYTARASNISKYTEGRHRPVHQLESNPIPIDGPDHPPRMDIQPGYDFNPADPSVLLLHEDDLSPDYLFDRGLKPSATVFLTTAHRLTPLEMSPDVMAFKRALMEDCAARYGERLGEVTFTTDPAEVTRIAGQHHVVTPYPPTGPVSEAVFEMKGVPVRRIMRPYDAAAWPYATAGFFKFKSQIPKLIAGMKGLRAA